MTASRGHKSANRVAVPGCRVWSRTAFLAMGLVAIACGPGQESIRGSVRHGEAPVVGATVRVQTTPRSTTTDGEGRFVLPVDDLAAGPFQLTAWAPGYFCAGPVEARAGQRHVEIQLEPHAAEDHPGYAWLTAFRGEGEGEDRGCAACHSRDGTELEFTLPFDEWRLDAHAGAARNPRFLTMYLGTDVNGNRSPRTRRVFDRDYGEMLLPPDPEKPYFGPGYRLEFPDTDGNCAACHAPMAAVEAPYSTDPSVLEGVAAEGIACDFCHKVWDVRLDPARGLPYPNRPGVLSFEFRRPPEGQQFFAGPYDDVAPGEDTYSPLQHESRICAPCHFGEFWETPIYNSFGEWLASPYSDPDTGRTCQDCHMPRIGATHVARPDEGGLARDPATIFGHRMPGAADLELLRGAVRLEATARFGDDELEVRVAITNDRTGHHVPTGSPLRHLILRIEARAPDGRSLAQRSGPVLPDWTGIGDPSEGNYAGLPGKAFAKVLRESWTGISPSASYWSPTRIVSDNRIAALATDTSSYRFEAPTAGRARVEVVLLFRRAFAEIARRKGWPAADAVMARDSLDVHPSGDAD